VVAVYGLCEHAKPVLLAPYRPQTTVNGRLDEKPPIALRQTQLYRTAIALTQNSATPRMKLAGRVAFYEGGHTLADPAQYKRQAQKCVRFAQRTRSAQEKRALIRLARTWSSLAAQTEAYEAILCKLDEVVTVDDKQSRLQ
jgi:hypothetical protein